MPKKNVPVPRSPWWYRAWDKCLYLLLIGIFFLRYPGQSIYTRSLGLPPARLPPLPVFLPSPALLPTNPSGIIPGEEITASGVVVLDVDSGIFLYKRHEKVPFSPASTTKILTALVALDIYNVDDVLTVKKVLSDGQVMHLVPGERMTVENLLYGALIHSGNDAAYVLADNDTGGVDTFVKRMNEKAKALHLTQSHFTNPVGFDDPAHSMTPLDLARLASFALNSKPIAKIVAIPQITISDVTHTYFHSLTNVNQLLGKIPGVGGIKTGWTEEAGENLVTLVERDGKKVIIVVLHSRDRFGDTTKLIDWVFRVHQWNRLHP